MTADQTANLVYSLLFLVLVVSSLVARRLPLRQTAKHALAWAAIFAGAVVLYSFRHVAGQAWEQIKRELNPSAPVQQGRAVRISKGEDGHFHVIAKVNDHKVEFLIDSGATTSTMSQGDAQAAGVAIDPSGFGAAVETANGTTVMRRAQIERLAIGNIERTQLPILVSAQVDELNLIGMNFLSSLKSWKVEGNEMILVP
jgi:aspartyl protease family protein